MKAAFPFSIIVLVSLCACADQGRGWQFPEHGQLPEFSADVMPVLIRDCSFQTCHGSSERFFRVWGPGRTRLNPMSRALDPLTGLELEANYNMALSMINPGDPKLSLLLRKPLAREAGGSAHGGADPLGRNVYRVPSDPGYATLQHWVESIIVGRPQMAPKP
jgi:hypothetical protein